MSAKKNKDKTVTEKKYILNCFRYNLTIFEIIIWSSHIEIPA